MPVARTRRSGVTSPVASTGEEAPRARILLAARQHFFRLGFARFTMDDLAAELGMSKKTLYLHFRRKEQIIDALIATLAEEIRSGFDAILAAPGLAFGERAARVMRHGVSKAGEMSSTFLHDLRRHAPASYARLEEFRRRVAPGVWERLLREGIEAGAVRRDLDPVATAQLILVALQSLLAPESLERLRLQPHELLARFMPLIFAGVLTTAGRSDYENTPIDFGVPLSPA